MAINKLTDTGLRRVKPGDKPFRLADGGGLFLRVDPNGGCYWHVVYRFPAGRAGKQKTLTLGSYPTVKLADARAARDDAKRLLARGVDPIEHREQQRKEAAKTRPTFRQVADDWFATMIVAAGRRENTRKSHARWIAKLSAAPTPGGKKFGDLYLDEIEPPDLLAAIRKVAPGKHVTARRMRAMASNVFQFGIASGAAKRDAAADVQKALTPVKHDKLPGLTDPAKVAQLMADVAHYQGRSSNRIGYALQILALTAVRPHMIRFAKWSEFDLDAATWTIPALKMKMDRAFIVPLAKQAVTLLSTLHAATGKQRYVFAGSDDQPLSTSAINKALQWLGYDTETEHCGHGFRTTFSTLLNAERERGKPVWHPDVIELSLAHKDENTVRGIYNEAMLEEDRAALMQHWADRIDHMRRGGAQIVPLMKKLGRVA